MHSYCTCMSYTVLVLCTLGVFTGEVNYYIAVFDFSLEHRE